MKLIILLLLLTIIITLSCNKQENCPSEFIVYGEVNPYDVKYRIGDTIRLSFAFSEMIYSKDKEKAFDMTGLKLEYGFLIYKIDSNETDIYFSVTDYCNILEQEKLDTQIDVFSNGTSMLSGTMYVSKQLNSFSLSFIPNKRGDYMLTFGAFANGSNNVINDCETFDINLCTRLNKGLDNNINLLKESPNEHFNTWMIAKTERFYETKSGFAYRVIE